jgi:erythronate-4-phosphate dehydrogenase
MNNRIKIVADNKIPFLKGVLEPYCEIEYLNPSDIVSEKIKDADALIIRTRTKCNAKLLEGSQVKFIATATIGHDHIDDKYCSEKNIKWINAPGCNSASVNQYIASALLSLAQKLSLNLNEMTIGIVGVGNVGSKIERTASILGMKVLLNDPPRFRNEKDAKFVPLNRIVEEADIITFHVPLIKEGIDKTFHIADEKFLNSLKKPVLLFNSSRGEVVDNTALKNAIKGGKVKATVLDVWEGEPLIDPELLTMVDIATPHIAGYSSDGKANGTSVCVNAVNEFFNLGIEKNWYPAELPSPDNMVELDIDCSGWSKMQIIRQAVLHTYDIMADSAELKRVPENFEKLRDYYKVRREFPAFKIHLKTPEKGIADVLINLGFNVEVSQI